MERQQPSQATTLLLAQTPGDKVREKHPLPYQRSTAVRPWLRQLPPHLNGDLYGGFAGVLWVNFASLDPLDIPLSCITNTSTIISDISAIRYYITIFQDQKDR